MGKEKCPLESQKRKERKIENLKMRKRESETRAAYMKIDVLPYYSTHTCGIYMRIDILPYHPPLLGYEGIPIAQDSPAPI